MPLHPETIAVLQLIKDSGRPPLHTLSPTEARETSARSRAIMQPTPPEVALVQDLTCPGPHGDIRLRHYRGAGTAADAVLPAVQPGKRRACHRVRPWRRLGHRRPGEP